MFSEDFEKFWKFHPNKKSKGQAWKTWQKLKNKKLLPEVDVLIDAICAQIRERERRKNLGLWVPEWKYPSTWLNALSWMDGVDDEADSRINKKTDADRAKEAANSITNRLVAARGDCDGGEVVATVDRAE